MTGEEVKSLVARLDPDAEVTFAPSGHPEVIVSAAMTEAGLAELTSEVPDAQIAFAPGSLLWAGMLEAMRKAARTGPSYELDDLNEDGSWKPGRKPEGWGEVP